MLSQCLQTTQHIHTAQHHTKVLAQSTLSLATVTGKIDLSKCPKIILFAINLLPPPPIPFPVLGFDEGIHLGQINPSMLTLHLHKTNPHLQTSPLFCLCIRSPLTIPTATATASAWVSPKETQSGTFLGASPIPLQLLPHLKH